MTGRAVVVLQARMGSQRLPGKVMAALAGHPLVEYCLLRLLAADVGPVVLATTTQADDGVLVDLAIDMGVEAFGGPSHDVLARFAAVAERHREATYVIRATADNPFVDIDAPTRVLKALSAGADYAVEEGLPMGAAVEGIRRDVLLRAQRQATSPYDREHVTPWARQHADVVRAQPLAPADVRATDLRLTVDTPADLACVRLIAEGLAEAGIDPRLAPLRDVIALARRLSGGASA